jgi:hypothetical protein
MFRAPDIQGAKSWSITNAARVRIMVIPLKGRIRWRNEAPFHVQLELQKDPSPPLEPRQFKVRGTVVRVFRSDGRLSIGDSVEFNLWICEPRDAPTGPAHTNRSSFMAASHLEAYLTGNPPLCRLAAYEFTLLSVPTNQPVMSVEQIERLGWNTPHQH